MAAGKGYGDMSGGNGRGVFSKKGATSPAPVPRKGSELDLKMEIQGKGADMVRKMGKEAARDESHRGMGG